MPVLGSRSISHKERVDRNRDKIFKWFENGATNDEVAERLKMSVAALQRHTMYWDLKKIPKRPVHKKPEQPTPCSDEIRHLALRAKWTTAA